MLNSSAKDANDNDDMQGQIMNQVASEFYELINDGNQGLYERCTKYLKLSILLKLYNIKCLYGMIDTAMAMILELLKDAFDHAKIPSSF